MSEFDQATRSVEDAGPGRPKRPGGEGAPPRRIVVDRRTHRVRLEDETGSGVTVVIEEKGGEG